MLFSLVLLSATATTPPHLAQAWTAMSTGDGLKGETGKESYYIHLRRLQGRPD